MKAGWGKKFFSVDFIVNQFNPRVVFDRGGPIAMGLYVAILFIILGLVFSFLEILATIGAFILLFYIIYFLIWVFLKLR
jgi:hypothetical protein